MEYRETGKKIPLTVEELHVHVIDKLYQYDELIKSTKTKPEQDPYVDPIVYVTKEGKTVQVPQNIQENAVKVWIAEKDQPVKNDDEDVLSDIDDLDDVKPKYNARKQVVVVKENKNFYMLLFFICIALFAGYMLAKK